MEELSYRKLIGVSDNMKTEVSLVYACLAWKVAESLILSEDVVEDN